MKRAMLLAALVTVALATKAQPYIIPWAQQQPDWVFPLWFESGDGQKDTLYLVYHPGLDPGNVLPGDTIYGIKYQCVSNDSFWLSANESSFCTDSTTLISKVYPITVGVLINHGKYPFKMKWDSQLLYDTILPFSNVLPKPIGRLRGFWYHFYSPPYYGVNENDILADTAGFPCYYPDIVKMDYDSVVFDGPLPDITNTSGSSELVIDINLVAQGEPCIVGNTSERAQVNLVSFHPNPFNTELVVQSLTHRVMELRMVNSLGQSCQTHLLYPGNNLTITLSHLPAGLYALVVKTDSATQTHKIVKL